MFLQNSRVFCSKIDLLTQTFSFFKRFSSNQSILASKEGQKNFISTLFVPGKFTGEMYQIVKPNVDVDYIVKNMKSIQQSCTYRGIDLNLKSCVALLLKWQLLKPEMEQLFKKSYDYSTKLKLLKSSESKNEFEALNKEFKSWLPIFNATKKEFYDLEDEIMPILIKIPNMLDHLTPIEQTKYEVCQDSTESDLNPLSHVIIGKKLGCLDFSDTSPTAYFLKGCLAELELKITYFFHDTFMDHNFSPLSGIDFCKSFIKEAIGVDPYSADDCIIISENGQKSGQQLNLVGGSSLETFCAYFTNMNFGKISLPLKYISTGRHYNAVNRTVVRSGLFTVVQSSNVQFCVLYDPSQSDDNSFNNAFQDIYDCYKQLKIPFRVAEVSAKYLSITESKRKQIEVWSPVLQQYIVCAYVSEHNDFLSQRLRISCGEGHQVDNYCGVVEGRIVNVPVLIGCIIENLQKSNLLFDIPDVLKNHATF